MDLLMKEIGVIHTPIKEKKDAPIQASRSDIAGAVEVFPQYLDGLDGIEDFSHIFLLYGFHQSEKDFALKVQPFLDDKEHGIFSTRFPCRPNPIGFSVVQLTGRFANNLQFFGADMLDGTPLLDIKPYIPEFDVFTVDKTGWYHHRKLP